MNEDEIDRSDVEINQVLAEYGLQVRPISIVVGPGAKAPQRFDVRVVGPLGSGSSENMFTRLFNLGLAEGTAGPEIDGALALLPLWGATIDPKRRLLRTVGPSSLWHTPSLRISRKIVGSGHAARTVPEAVRALAPPIPDLPIEELLQHAIYVEPLPLEIDPDAYERFVESTLREAARLWDSVETGEVGRRARERAETRIRRKQPEYVITDEQWAAHLESSSRRALRPFCMIDPKQHAVDLRIIPLIQRARALLSDRWPGSLEWDSKKAQQLGTAEEVVQFLNETLTVLEELGAKGDRWAADSARAIGQALRTNEPRERAGAIFELAKLPEPGSVLMEALLREADLLPSYLVGRGAKQVYRRIRRFLTPAERRLFVLMYFDHVPGFGGASPSLFFNGWSFSLLPFANSLLSDEELVTMAILVLAFKKGVIRGEDLGARLSKLFRQHLAFHAWWSKLIRIDDKDRKRKTRAKERQTSFYRRDGRERPEARDTSAGPEEHLIDAEAAGSLGAFRERFEKWFQERVDVAAPLERHRVAKMFLVEGMNETLIASITGRTQQSVSKNLNKFLAIDFAPTIGIPLDRLKALLHGGGVLRRGRPRRRTT